ncbi:acyltransferase family protein [Nocardia sp. CA-119907]|uniref:acyltransferase family protein n=1 Tax=Nocardia sp. CA-119907 TaxID=3239973 RepID=UPI003D97594E
MVTQPDRATRSDVLERDWTIDIVRVCSITVVVVVHWISVRVILVDGAVRGEQALHGRPIWVLTWPLQVMPMFFLAGGFANTLIVDRYRARGRTYGDYLGLRVRRLTTPMIALIAFIVALDVGLDAFSERAAAAAADIVASPLWFLAVFLIAAMVAPFAVRAHDVSALLAPVVLFGCSFAVDLLRFGGVYWFAEWNLIFVWLFCHQLGILYARGTLGPVGDGTVLLIAAAGIGVLIVMVVPGPYFPTMLGLADAPVSNLAPPTTAMSILAVTQFAALVLVSRRLTGWEPHGRARRVITTGATQSMNIYLWHVPAMAIVTGVALAVPVLLPSDAGTWWAARPLWMVAAAVVLFGFVRITGRWDAFCARYAARTATLPVLAGSLLAAAGIFALWRYGLSPYGMAGLATLTVVLAAALLTTTRRITPPDNYNPSSARTG